MKKIESIRTSNQQKGSCSPKGEVGEIDTRAPFQSVKDAVSLFGEVAVSREKVTTPIKRSKFSSENVLDNETQLLLAQRELDKYKHQLKNTETTKAPVHTELEKAKETLMDLTAKFNIASESKRLAIEAAEVVTNRAEQLEVEKSQQSLGNAARKVELDQATQQYMMVANELDAAKQMLTKVRQDFDAALEGKLASFQQAAEAQRLANINKQRIKELSNEIKDMKESKQQLNLASVQAQEQEAKIATEKDARIEACKIAKAGVEINLETLKGQYDSELSRNLKEKLAETSAEIEVLQEEMKKTHAFEMDAVKVVTSELNEATKTLEQVAKEENFFRNMVTSLRLELANVKREQAELQEKEAVKEFVRGEREKYASVQQSSTLEQLSLEITSKKWEVEEMIKNGERLMQEAEKFRLISKEKEEKLKLALKEIEEAIAAEKIAHDKMKIISERNNAQNQDLGKTIKISLEDLDSLQRKVRECKDTAETKVTDAMIQIETINASKYEVEKKLIANLKAIEEIKEATEIALKSAQMAEAARYMVESELRKWSQEEQIMEV